MIKRARKNAALPLAVAQLTLASWETIFRRSLMMATGTCSPAEYHRMSAEKMAAAGQSFLALASGQGPDAILAPYLRRARANARRLRTNN